MKETVKYVSEGKEFDSKFGKIYYHNIEFVSGKKGQFSTNKNPQDKFMPGVEYDIVEIDKVSRNGNPYKFYDKEKIDNPQFSKKAGVYESHYDKPEVVKSISKSVSFTHATKFLAQLDIDTQGEMKRTETFLKYAKKIYDFYYKDWDANNSNQINSHLNLKRRTSFEIVLGLAELPFESIHLTSFDAYLNYADIIFQELMKDA